MDISNKQIAQILAPYLGQDMITKTRQYEGEGKPAKYLKGKFLEIDLGMVDSFIGVLLENETEPSNHTNYNINEVKLILKPLSEITNEDAKEAIVIWGEAPYPFGAITVNSRPSKWSRVIIEQSKRLPHFVFQYLKSKGYDLPNYLLEGKTLKEAGMAIYDNEMD